MYWAIGMSAPRLAHSPTSRDVPRSTMSGGVPPLIAVRILAEFVTGVSVIRTPGLRASYSLMTLSSAASSWPPPHCCHIVRLTTFAPAETAVAEPVRLPRTTAPPTNERVTKRIDMPIPPPAVLAHGHQSG